MRKLIIACSLLTVLFSLSSLASSTVEQAKETMENLHFMKGKWYLMNRSLNPDQTYTTQSFYVNTSIKGGGQLLESTWKALDSDIEVNIEKLPKSKVLKKHSEFFGKVILSYMPTEEKLYTNYFNAANSTWSITGKAVSISEGLIESSGEGTDGFGHFLFYTKNQKLSDDKIIWSSQRFYDSLGFWITVDAYEAYRLKK